MASALSALRAACQHGGEPDIVAAEFATAVARRLADLPGSARELVELVAAAKGTRGSLTLRMMNVILMG
jgi:hypothetical protein